MAHEFKTPIATISLASDYIQKNGDNAEKNSNYAAIIMRENMRLKNHVERVLEIAKPEKYKSELSIEETDVVPVIQEAMEHTKLANPNKEVHCDLVNHSSDSKVYVDPMHLYNVFQNLLDNSVKYSERSPIIQVSLEDQHNMLQITLEDNGIGIPRKYQSRIFDRFFRVPKGETHDVKGFGIGLSYVKMILKKMSGSIKLVNSTHEGTTFLIKLPKIEQ